MLRAPALLVLFGGALGALHATLASPSFAQEGGLSQMPSRIATFQVPFEAVETQLICSVEKRTRSKVALAQATDEMPGAADSAPGNPYEEKDVDSQAKQDVEVRNLRRIESLRKPLRSIRIVAATPDTVPTNVAEELLTQEEPITISSTGETVTRPDRYTTSFCHRPLYFEELNLERCGNTYGCATNVVSGLHFLTNTAMLPYRIATQRPDCLEPTRGDCQSCQEYSHDIEPFGFEPRGVLVEAAAAAGFVFLMM